MVSYAHDSAALIELLEEVKDPEIPVLSIVDLGVLRHVAPLGDDSWEITITPTYSGCPAMDTIENDIDKLLTSKGIKARIVTSLHPAWTTDWLSAKGRRALEVYGIAPPVERTSDKSFLKGEHKMVPCPHCKGKQTALLSQFGSTACKALYKCDNCLETFDYFKCI